MATRRIEATLDTFSVDSGSEITYVGGSTTGDKSDDVRGFEVNPGGTGNIIVNLERTSGIRNVQIFQKDAFDGSSSPAGYQRFFDIEKAGKGKGAVEFWAARVKPGKILFEIDGVPKDLAEEAFSLASAKLPNKNKFVKRLGA